LSIGIQAGRPIDVEAESLGAARRIVEETEAIIA
jgi:hypothetical protein